ncbi:ATP-binding protein [Planomonospora sp. ID67723]|uniref:ATP-binding protein n=1 Tax=Planomonospora sp. ID67723 TaxID=2738134 RepID=UPI0018C374CB|nr:ATP-binding protein [Planomonospora sp. ID67723]MBG0832593.1 ATP-binding protein [Planomonospora sp. ID67723]
MEATVRAYAAPVGHRLPLDPALVVLGEKRIPRDGRCVSSVRRFVRDTALDWSAAGDVPELAELLASELATNALVHGTADDPATSTIRVTVSRERELLSVNVHDPCPAIPRMREADEFAVSGRGLAIVETFSHAWGWKLTSYGKSVWFQLAAWS